MSLTVLIEVTTMFLIVSYAVGFSFGLKIIREPNAASSADQDLAMIDKVSYYSFNWHDIRPYSLQNLRHVVLIEKVNGFDAIK